MNRIILIGLFVLSASLPLFAQEAAPILDSSFGIKPFSMGGDWIVDVQQAPDGSFYIAEEDQGLTKLDAYGNQLWTRPHHATGSCVGTYGIAVDSGSNVYLGVNDYCNRTAQISKFNSEGAVTNSFALTGVCGFVDDVAFNNELNRLYTVSNCPGAWGRNSILIKMFNNNLTLLKSMVYNSPSSPHTWAGDGVGLDEIGNVYISGGSYKNSYSVYTNIGVKFNPNLDLAWEYSEVATPGDPVFSEAIPEGGMYLGRDDNPSRLSNISNEGAKRWEKAVSEDYQYYKGVDKDGDFYGATWDEDNNWVPTISKLGYDDGEVKWKIAEQYSEEIADIFIDSQTRVYTVGNLLAPVGDVNFYIARYIHSDDTIAPVEVSNLVVTGVSSNSITLSWTAPGDDLSTGTPSGYDLRYTTAGQISSDLDFNSATQVQGEPIPNTAGSVETFTLMGLTPGTVYFFAIKTADEAGNISGLSNSPQGITVAVPKDKYEIYGDTKPTIVVVNTWSAPLEGLVNIFGTTNPASGVKVDFSISTWPAGAQGQELSKSTEAANANGIADVLLRLGNIPAEYDVTAICNSCEASASSVTFTCCGKLTNTDFKQYDIAWSTHSYDDRCHLIGSTVPFNCNPLSPPANSVPFNIRQRGCAMTAMANVLNYYHDRYALTYATTTPLALNQYLRDNTGFDSGDVKFSRVMDYTLSERTVCYSGKTELRDTTLNALRNRIDANLAQGNPVILRVPSPTNPSHFVVAIGKCEGNYLIADPGQDRATINPSQIRGIREFTLVEGNICPIP